MENHSKEINQPTRLVLVPCPFQGHINPMLQLGTILHSRGFSITIAHSRFNSPDPSNHPAGFNFLPIQDGLADHPRVDMYGDIAALVMLINASCKDPFLESLHQLMEQPMKTSDETIACVVYDEFMYFVAEAASRLKLPSMILRTTSATSFIFRNAVPWYESEGLRSHDIVPQFHPLRLKDLPVAKSRSPEYLLSVIDHASNTKTSSAVIFNTLDFLEQLSLRKIQQQCELPVFSIGPLNKLAPGGFTSSLMKEDYTCITWLGKQTKSSVLYVSLGSLYSMTENELAEMAWGLADSKQPFLWVVPPGSVVGSDWIESLPVGFKEDVRERGCIVKWAPQTKVLAHESVGGFWSHCGWNSTLESISEGVPMICRPSSWDQLVNARYVSYVWKVGLEFENEVLERGEVERVVKRLMMDREGIQIRERAMDLKEKVEVCLMKNGSSSSSLNELEELIKSF